MAFLLILRRDQRQELGIEYQTMLERFQAWTGGLAASGALKGVERLKEASAGVTLRLEGGKVAATGRYPGDEDVIGYYLIDVADAEEAKRLASDCPILAAGGSVEVRETDPFMPSDS